jgi:hypothetical protein
MPDISTHPEFLPESMLLPAFCTRASSEDDIKRIANLLAQNPKCINQVDLDGYTLLHLALKRAEKALQGGEEIIEDMIKGLLVEMLVEKGSDIHARDNAGNTPLVFAVASDYISAVEFLLEKGADIYVRGHSGATLLHIAAENGAIICVAFLCERLDVNESNNYGDTALHYILSCTLPAASFDKRALDKRAMVIDHLLRVGANVYLSNMAGETPNNLLLQAAQKESQLQEILNNYRALEAGVMTLYGLSESEVQGGVIPTCLRLIWAYFQILESKMDLQNTMRSPLFHRIATELDNIDAPRLVSIIIQSCKGFKYHEDYINHVVSCGQGPSFTPSLGI